MIRLRTVLAALTLATLAAPVGAQAPEAAFHVRRADQALPDYLFRVNVNGGAVFGGTYDGGTNSGGIPAEGEGTRMMWYPEKAAFRAGGVRSGVFLYDDTGLPTNTSGTSWNDANIGYYSAAFGLSTRASANYAFAVGLGSVAANVSSVAMGEANTASGAASVALGYHAHTNARQGSFVFSDRSNVALVRAGSNHQATFRTACGFRIFTSSNQSTGIAIGGGAVSDLGTSCPDSYFGQSGTMIATSTGAYLSSGGAWTNSSDRNRKHRFEAVSGEDVLARLQGMPVQTWSYRVDPDSVRHMGPTAQDFHTAFGLNGADSTHIATVDADGVLFASVQALEARTRALEAEVETLRAERDAARTTNAAFPAIGAFALVGLAGFGFRRRRAARTPDARS